MGLEELRWTNSGQEENPIGDQARGQLVPLRILGLQIMVGAVGLTHFDWGLVGKDQITQCQVTMLGWAVYPGEVNLHGINRLKVTIAGKSTGATHMPTKAVCNIDN